VLRLNLQLSYTFSARLGAYPTVMSNSRGNVTFAEKRNILARDIVDSSEFASRTT